MKLRGILPTAIAIATGILVLLGYFLNLTVLIDLRIMLLNWAVILAAFALFVGVINLVVVHTNKIRQKQTGMVYSLFLIFSLLLTLVIGLVRGPEDPWVILIFNSVQLPIEASLMALLAITLTYASIRLLRRRLGVVSIIFVVTAFLILLGTAPLPLIGSLPFVGDLLRPFIAQVLAAGGARGILLGVALGTLTTGLRILAGADRPYEGSNG